MLQILVNLLHAKTMENVILRMARSNVSVPYHTLVLFVKIIGIHANLVDVSMEEAVFQMKTLLIIRVHVKKDLKACYVKKN